MRGNSTNSGGILCGILECGRRCANHPHGPLGVSFGAKRQRRQRPTIGWKKMTTCDVSWAFGAFRISRFIPSGAILVNKIKTFAVAFLKKAAVNVFIYKPEESNSNKCVCVLQPGMDK